MKIPILQTDRLILRPLSLDDVPAIQKYFDNWNIVKYTVAPWPYPEDGAASHIDQTLSAIEEGHQISWAITLKETQEFIGRIDYRVKDTPPGRGFWIAEPFQGQGYMTEAVAVTQDYIFFDYGLERFEVDNFKGNQGSRRVKEKTGAIFLGEKPKIVRGEEIIAECWEVTKESWEAARKKMSAQD